MADSRPRRLFTIERNSGTGGDKAGTTARAPFAAGRGAAASVPPVGDADAGTRHREVMAAIETLTAEVQRLSSAKPASAPEPAPSAVDPDYFKQQIIEAEKLRGELQELSDAIERTKSEIAALRKTDGATDKLTTAGAALRAVVSDTETATDGIINAAEAIEELGARIGAQGGGDVTALTDELGELVTAIFEHCNFQDITGQRITKVVQTMEFIDERVARMMEIWGGDDAFAGVESEAPPAGGAPTGEKLDGPSADPELKISQDDIDKLFD